MIQKEAGEMAQQVKVFAVKPDSLSDPQKHIKMEGENCPYGLSLDLHTSAMVHTSTQ